jgi:sugar transferase (PEP-CTERM/EpsH1 system associated)
MNILWVKNELLHPLDKGGRILSFHIIKELAKKNKVTYLCYADPENEKDAVKELDRYVDTVLTIPKKTKEKYTFGFYIELLFSLVSPLPYTIRKYYSSSMAIYLKNLVTDENFDAIVCDSLALSFNFDLNMRNRSLLLQHNIESRIWERHVQVQSNLVKKLFFYQEWKKLLRYEERTCKEFQMILAVSREDRDWFKNYFTVNRVFAIPIGVDTKYFSPLKNEVQKSNIVFTGSMDWLPNEDAVIWFVNEIMPLVRKKNPSIKFTIAGRKPTPSVRRLALDYPDVEVTGDVQDIRPYMERASVFVVPIRIGGGTRLKIFEAMAMGKAVVSTTIGAEGLPVKDGEHLLLADTPQDFSEQINKLMEKKDFAKRLGQSARRYVSDNYSWEKVSDLFLEAISNPELKGNEFQQQ